jgi:hypothetical protein
VGDEFLAVSAMLRLAAANVARVNLRAGSSSAASVAGGMRSLAAPSADTARSSKSEMSCGSVRIGRSALVWRRARRAAA